MAAIWLLPARRRSKGVGAVFVAAIHLELSLPYARSLKEKRMALNSLMDRVRTRFGASVAEVGQQDVWQRAEVGVALVSGEERHLREMAAKVTEFVASHWEGEICAAQVEIL